MPFSELSIKQRRILDVELNLLFSRKAIELSMKPDKMVRLGLFHPWLKNEDGSGLPLTTRAVAALERIAEQLETLVESDDLSDRELRSEVLRHYTNWFRRRLHPNPEEFVTEILSDLTGLIGDHHFLVVLHGLKLEDRDLFDFGVFQLRCPSEAFLSQIKLGGSIKPDWTFEQFNRGVWLTAAVRGSQDTALSRFDEHRHLTSGLLSALGAILYEAAFCRTRIESRIGFCTTRKTPSLLRWMAGGEEPSVSWDGDHSALLIFNDSSFAYLRDQCFLSRFSAIFEKRQRSEIEDSVIRALYWFGDAQSDRNITMRFIKLWSCVECFFSIRKEDITQLVTKGMATVLTFAGYHLFEVDHYARFKRDLRRYYDLRSRCLHRGEYGVVSNEQLADFSRWVAWLIVSAVALTERGYQKLSQLNEQAERLDAIATRKR